MQTYFDSVRREYVVCVSEQEAKELAFGCDPLAIEEVTMKAVFDAHLERKFAERRRIAKWNRRQFSS